MTTGVLLVGKATVILLVALGLDAWLRKRHVLTCAAMWEGILVVLLLLPAVAMYLPPLRLSILLDTTGAATALALPATDSRLLPAQPESARSTSAMSTRDDDQAGSTGNVVTHPAAISAQMPNHTVSWPTLGQVIATVYFVGVFGYLIRLVVAVIATARLRVTGTAVRCAGWISSLVHWREKLNRRDVELRESSRVRVPSMVGLFHPTILIPANMVDESDGQYRDAILVHEFGHILRGDFGWQLIMRVVQAALWFHPLMWLAERRIHFIRERACDDFAIHAMGNSKEYVDVLLRIASGLHKPHRLALGLAVMRTPHIAARLEATADSHGNERCSLALPGRLTVLMAIVASACALACLSLEAKQRGQRPETKPAPQLVNALPGVVAGEVVLAEGGAPVAGATVLLRAGRLRREKTDDAGRFQFSDVPQGHYSIWAIKESLVCPQQQLIGQETGTDTRPLFSSVRLSMNVGKQIRVNVTSALNGQPIEGATVELGYPDRQKKLTGKDGTAVLEALLPQSYSMTVMAPGHARAIREVDLRSADNVTRALVSLASGGTIRGIVADEHQSPLAKADVVFRTSGSPVGFYGDSPYANERGEYRCLYLPLNTPIQVSARLKDHLELSREVTLTEQQRDLELNFVLKKRPPGGTVRGVVTDLQGKPIAAASITNFAEGLDEKRETKSDELGRFTLQDVVKTFVGYELTVRAPGFVPVLHKFELAAADNTAAVFIQLEKGHSIRARVQDSARRPITGAFVTVNGGDLPGQLGEFLRTDRDGEFRSDSLLAPSKFKIYARGHSSTEELSLALDGKEPVIVTLEPAGILRGRVVDSENSTAIQQFRVRVTFSPDQRPGDVRTSYNSELHEPGLSFHAKDGAFVIHELTNRMPFQVTVEADAYEPATVERVVARSTELAEVTTIELQKCQRVKPASVSGVVLDDQEKPVPGVQLRLIVSNTPAIGVDDGRFNWVLIDVGQLASKDYVEQYLSAVTNTDGKFEFKEIRPDKYLQLAYWGDRAPKGRELAFEKTAPGASQSITINLPKPATVHGSFEKEPFAKASQVRLSQQDRSFQDYQYPILEGKTDFAFQNLPPGRYWLSIIGQPERNSKDPQLITLRPIASRLVTIEPGDTVEVNFTKDDLTELRN
jgi:beta-lactamase regulating signal transducer with metallopeptidase domain